MEPYWWLLDGQISHPQKRKQLQRPRRYTQQRQATNNNDKRQQRSNYKRAGVNKMKICEFQIALLCILGLHCDAFITPSSSSSSVAQSPSWARKDVQGKNKSYQSIQQTQTQPQTKTRVYNSALSTGIENEDVDEKSLKEVKSKLTKEFFSIGFPAFIQLAAEPLASLVDTAYLGRLGPEVLGGAGVAISAQYAVSKLYNDPLLRTSISLVASQDGKARSSQMKKNKDGSSDTASMEEEAAVANKELSIAVSSGLLLALTVGVIQLIVYSVLASGIIKGMGVTPASPMWNSAFSYLRMRALGTPAATLWLVTNGIFRGLGDTRTPLIYSLAFTAMNAALDPLFIFTFKFGASGAALGTLLAQYIALVPLMMALNRKVKIDLFGQLKELKQTLVAYIEAGSYVLFRSLGKVLAYSVCAREAALLGPIAAAAYNLTFQLGFATTQICESVAVAVQTLLAREIADDESRPAKVRITAVRHLIKGSIAVGGIVATSLSLLTFFQRKSVMQGLTSNVAVRDAGLAIFPAVLATQVTKGLAYPVNGINMGGLDWKFSMIAMWIANIVCVGIIKFGSGAMTLNRIWWALCAFMGTQVVTGILRVESKTGIWKLLKEEKRN